MDHQDGDCGGEPSPEYPIDSIEFELAGSQTHRGCAVIIRLVLLRSSLKKLFPDLTATY